MPEERERANIGERKGKSEMERRKGGWGKEKETFFRNIESRHEKSRVWPRGSSTCGFLGESRTVLCCTEVTFSFFQSVTVKTGRSDRGGGRDVEKAKASDDINRGS